MKPTDENGEDIEFVTIADIKNYHENWNDWILIYKGEPIDNFHLSKGIAYDYEDEDEEEETNAE